MASHSVYLCVSVRSSVILQVVKMNLWILNVFLISNYLICYIDSVPAVNKLSRQFLPSLPGYVPVYIRPGDTPLEEINLELAEAFKSNAFKHTGLINFDQENNLLYDSRESSSFNQPHRQHIQKIPRI